jgi:hypothetical protein
MWKIEHMLWHCPQVAKAGNYSQINAEVECARPGKLVVVQEIRSVAGKV